jgi:S-adenosyl methyltransferase/Nitroreductase family
VRRRLDLAREVSLDVVAECLSIALQAPNGSNLQPWHFVIVTEPDRKRALGDLYRDAYVDYQAMPFSAHQFAAGDAGAQRVAESGDHLAAHLQDIPVLVIPCVPVRLDDQPPFMTASILGSVFPRHMEFTILHTVLDQADPWATVARYVDAVSSGSYLAISHLTGDFNPEVMAQVKDVLDEDMAEPFVLRSSDEILRFFSGTELVEPGVVHINDWHLEIAPSPPPPAGDVAAPIYGGVGRKP